MWFSHPTRTNVVDEAKRILLYYPQLEDVMDRQLQWYDNNGFKDNKGLYQNGFFVREHKEETNNFCNIINEICWLFCHRDQLALPYALYMTDYKLTNVHKGHSTSRWITLNKHL